MNRFPGHTVRTGLALLAGLFFVPALLSAQQIQVRAVAAPVNALSISDVDFVNSTSPKWLFTVDIDAGGRSIDAIMTITLEARLASGETYRPAVTMTTRPFAIQSTRTLTNLDIGKGKPVEVASNVKDPDAQHKFENIALPSGIMPAGTYTFDIAVNEVTPGSAHGETSFTIELSNPTSVELLFPTDGDESVSQLPLFQWMFDGQRSRIAIFEKLPNQSSLEEAVNGDTLLSREVTSTVFQYPGAGVRALLPGRTYVWYVEGYANAIGGGNHVIRSPLRSFRVESGSGANASLLDELERSLDPKYKPVFDQIKAEGLMPFGSARLNGSAVAGPDLMQLLNFIRNNPDAVLSVGVE